VDLSAIASVMAAVLREELDAQADDDQGERIAELERRLARAETEAEQYKERFEEARARADSLEAQRLQLNQKMIALAGTLEELRQKPAELTAPPTLPAAPVNPRPWWRLW
jgi:chromosome segregation ATPase